MAQTLEPTSGEKRLSKEARGEGETTPTAPRERERDLTPTHVLGQGTAGPHHSEEGSETSDHQSYY